MILEVAVLDVLPGKQGEFELNFSKAQEIISSMKGYKSHQLQRCLEKDNRHMLLVTWEKLEDHTIGFRQSKEYQAWRELLHQFYDPFPLVEHYQLVYEKQVKA